MNVNYDDELSVECKKVEKVFFDGRKTAKAGSVSVWSDQLIYVGQSNCRSEVYTLQIGCKGVPKCVMKSKTLSYSFPSWTVNGIVALADEGGNSVYSLTAPTSSKVSDLKSKRELYSMNDGKWLLLLHGDTHSFLESVSVRPQICDDLFSQAAAILTWSLTTKCWEIAVNIDFEGAFFTGMSENSQIALLGSSRGCLLVAKDNFAVSWIDLCNFGLFYPQISDLNTFVYFCAFEGSRRQVYRAPIARWATERTEAALDKTELVYQSPFDCTRLKLAGDHLYFLESKNHCHQFRCVSSDAFTVNEMLMINGYVFDYVVISAKIIVANMSLADEPGSLYCIDLQSGKMENLLQPLAATTVLTPVCTTLHQCALGDYWSIHAAGGSTSACGGKLIINVHAGHPYEAICTYHPLHQLFLERGFTVIVPNYAEHISGRDFFSFRARCSSLRSWLIYFKTFFSPELVVVYGSSSGAVLIEMLALSNTYQCLADGYVMHVPLLFSNQEMKKGNNESTAQFFVQPSMYFLGSNDIYCNVDAKRAQLDAHVALGAPVSYVCFEDSGHESSELFSQLTYFRCMDRFVSQVALESKKRNRNNTLSQLWEIQIDKSASQSSANYCVVIHVKDDDEDKLVLSVISVIRNTPDDVELVFAADSSGRRFSLASLAAFVRLRVRDSSSADLLVASLNTRARVIVLPPIRSILSEYLPGLRKAVVASLDVSTEYFVFIDSDMILGLRLEYKLNFSNIELTDCQPIVIRTKSARQLLQLALAVPCGKHEEEHARLPQSLFEHNRNIESTIHSLPPRQIVAFEIQSATDEQFFLPCSFSDKNKPFAVIIRHSGIPEAIKLDYVAHSIGINLFPKDCRPLVSCLMVTRLRLQYVKVAYQCFVQQTYPNKELVVVPDEDPETAAWFNSLNDPRVRVIEYERPTTRGVRHTLGRLRNVSMENAAGEYVMVWDDDDYYHPCRIGSMMQVMQEKQVDCVILGHMMAVWNPSHKEDAVLLINDLDLNNNRADLDRSNLGCSNDAVQQIQRVRKHRGATSLAVLGYDSSTHQLESVTYDETANALNVFVEAVQNSSFSIHFVLWRPHSMVKRTSSLHGPLLLMTVLNSADAHQFATSLLQSVRKCVGQCDEEVLLSPPVTPHARVTSFRPWEPTILLKRSLAPLYPELRKREDTKFVESFPGKKHVVRDPCFSILYLYRIHASNTWSVTHFEALFAMGESPSYHFRLPSGLTTHRLSMKLFHILSGKLSADQVPFKHENVALRLLDYPIFEVQRTQLECIAPFFLIIASSSAEKLAIQAAAVLHQARAGETESVIKRYSANQMCQSGYCFKRNVVALISGTQKRHLLWALRQVSLCTRLLTPSNAGNDNGDTGTVVSHQFSYQDFNTQSNLSTWNGENDDRTGTSGSNSKASRRSTHNDAKLLLSVPENCSSLQQRPSVAFIFPGQGGNFPESLRVCRQLMHVFPLFKQVVLQCDEILKTRCNGQIVDLLTPNNTTSFTSPDSISLPVYHAFLFAVRVGLFEVWKSLGLSPNFVLGHSLGEYAAAVACGILSLDHALIMIIERAKLLTNGSTLHEEGLMIAIHGADRLVVQEAIASEGLARAVVIAVSNSPVDFVISGPKPSTQRVWQRLQTNRTSLSGTVLKTSGIAYHSPFLDSILEPFSDFAKRESINVHHGDSSAAVSDVVFVPTGLPQAEASPPNATERITLQYWVNQSRNEVMFGNAINSVQRWSRRHETVFVEMCPVSFLRKIVARCGVPVSRILSGSCCSRAHPIQQCVWDTFVELVAAGFDVRNPMHHFDLTNGVAREGTVKPIEKEHTGGVKAISGASDDHFLETQLRSVIQSFLNLDETEAALIAPTTSMISLGMDSLHSIQAAAHLNRLFDFEVPPELFLESETFGDVVSCLMRQKQLIQGQDASQPTEEFQELDNLASGTGQELRFPVTENEDWFLNLNYAADWMILKARFQVDSLDLAKLRQAWARLCVRHEVLMSTYRVDEKEECWTRIVLLEPPPVVAVEFDRKLDYQNFLSVQGRDMLSYVDPLCRCFSISLPKQRRCEVVVLCHHVALDLVALNSLVVPELILLYSKKTLPPAGITLRQLVTYRDFNTPNQVTEIPWKLPLEVISLVSPRGSNLIIREELPAVSSSQMKKFLSLYPFDLSKAAVICYAVLHTCMLQTGQQKGYISLMHHGRNTRKYVDQHGAVSEFNLWRTVTNAFRAKKVVIQLSSSRSSGGSSSKEKENSNNGLLATDLQHVDTQLKITEEEIDSPEECFLINYHVRNADSADMVPFQKMGWTRKGIDFNLKTFTPADLNSKSLIIEESARGDLFFTWNFHPRVTEPSSHKFISLVHQSLRTLSLSPASIAEVGSLHNDDSTAVSGTPRKTVLFCCHPMFSRMNQILPIVQGLTKSSGTKCIVLGTAQFQNAIVRAGGLFWPLNEVHSTITKAGQGDVSWKPAHFAIWMIRQAVDHLPLLLEQIQDNYHQKIDLMLCDSSFWAGLFAAEMCAIPCTLLHMGLAVNSKFSWINFDFANDRPSAEVFDYYMSLLVSRHQVKPGRTAEDMWLSPQMAPKSVAFVAQNFQPQIDQFDLSTTFFSGPSFFDGTRMSLAESHVLDNIPADRQTPLIYISLGTIYNQNDKFYLACLEALSSMTQYNFVLVIGKHVERSQLGSIPPNFFLFSFVDQCQVLENCSLFITHGGVNSCQESLYYGVPMIVVPQQLDQFIVARRVEQLKVGIQIDMKDARSRLYPAVDRVMTKSSFGEAAAKFKHYMREESSLPNLKRFLFGN